MAKKLEEVIVEETKADKICKAVEFAILPVAVVLMIFSFRFAITCAGIAGLAVSGWKLFKEFLKHNKNIKRK